MSNILLLNQPTVGSGLQTYTLTIPAAGLYSASIQASVPQALPIGSAAGSGFGKGAGAGGGTLGGFALGGQVPVVAVPAVPAVAASLVDQTITYTAVTAGLAGNDISIELLDPGTSASLSINTVGNSIIVTLANSGAAITTTRAQLVAAINADPNASLVITAAGAGATAMAALATTSLTGGLAIVPAIPASGSGAKGQGFGSASDGYQQPPVSVTSNAQGAGVASSLSVTVVNTTTSTTLYTSTTPTISQEAVMAKVPFSAALNDVITITYSSSAASDKVLNGVKSVTTIQQGF